MDPQHPTDPRPETAPDASAAAYPQVVPSETDVDVDAAGDPVQSAVRTLLRNAPDPGPMPADLSRRIEMSLAQAAVRRAGDDELFDELGFSDPDAVHSVEEADDVIVFTGEPHDGHQDDNVVPLLQRRRWPLIGVAAAIVAFLAIAGAVVAQQRSTTTASRRSRRREARPGRPGRSTCRSATPPTPRTVSSRRPRPSSPPPAPTPASATPRRPARSSRRPAPPRASTR